jgi:hypothetical protein
VAAGGRHTCALLTGGTVECFGSNEFGQLGSLTSSGTATPVPTPTVTQALGGTAAALTTGNNHSCVLLSLGIVKCFGLNDRGQLGGSPDSAGTNDPNPTPVQTGSGAGVITIRAGGSHSCAILDDGLLRCVGDNSRGQIGSTFTGYTYIPFTVPTIDLIVPESPAVTPPTTTLPTTKPPVVTLARSKFKSVLRRGKLNVSGLVTAAGQGINATNCRGKIAINAKLKKKTLANRKFTLKFSGGKCAASVKFHFAKKYDGKKPTFRLSLSGSSTLTATASSFKSKL